MGVGDRVGFYLLPRSKAKSSPPSSTCSQSRFPPIDTDQPTKSTGSSLSTRSERATGQRFSRIRTREERKQPSLVKDIPNEELINTYKELLPQRTRTRTNQLFKTPEVLFESTPLYSPKDPTENSQVLHIPSINVKPGKGNIGQQQSLKLEGQDIRNPSDIVVEKSNSMLSEITGQKGSHKDLEDKPYKENFEDRSGEVFRSSSPGNGNIHNMRIHAGIMINTQSTQRRGEGRYNSK